MSPPIRRVLPVVSGLSLVVGSAVKGIRSVSVGGPGSSRFQVFLDNLEWDGFGCTGRFTVTDSWGEVHQAWRGGPMKVFTHRDFCQVYVSDPAAAPGRIEAILDAIGDEVI